MAEVMSTRTLPTRSPSSTSLNLDAFSLPRRNHYSLPDLRSPSLSSSHTSSSLRSTPSSSLSLDTKSDESSSDEELAFPQYSSVARYRKAADVLPVQSTCDDDESAVLSPLPLQSHPEGFSSHTPLAMPDPLQISEDDTAVRKEPSHHVDYLSYDWREEDIWSSWRHIVEHRNVYGERSRLENASWRTWAKAQFKLKTVSPETLNWLKDVDVTWLYGPMQPASNRFCSQQNSGTTSRLSKSSSFVSSVKKPILKKRSMSEAMLQRSISTSSLIQQAAESVQSQQQIGATLERRRPRSIIGGGAIFDLPTSSTMSRTFSREPTDYFSSRPTSGSDTPDLGEKKHIRFDDNVEQCIAVECKDDDEEDFNHNPWAKYNDEDSSSDEGVVMMKRARKRRPLSRTSSKISVTGDNKTIAKLPSTTLKYKTDSLDANEHPQSHSLGLWRSNKMSPSPSQETLKPSNPSRNFLLSDDDDQNDEADDYFNPSGAYDVKRPMTPTASDPYSQRSNSPPTIEGEAGGLRRTPSGMFMPFEDMDDEPQPQGLLGRVVDTFNTARDIAHVIYNVGLRN